MSRVVKFASLLVLLVGIAVAGRWYWLQASSVRKTENAYVNADIVQVASQLAGPVVHLYVHEGDLVKIGQPLFDIDPAPYAVALQQAEAKLAEAAQGNRVNATGVDAGRAALAQAEIDLSNAQNVARRTDNLVQQKFLSLQAEDDARAKLKISEAGAVQARAKLAGAQAQVATVDGVTPAVLAARAAVEQAKLDLAHTRVVASKDGWITNISLVPGTAVGANIPLFALIVRGSFWVDANFKETELPGIHPGQSTNVEIDMQPDHLFKGSVEIIGNGTGAAFSLLPAQNATGNWVKVTQRVPVRIRLREEDAQQPLRVGASARVTVSLKS